MDDPNSRYNRSAVLTWTASDGTSLPYLERRWLPAGSAEPLVRVTVAAGDRLDQLAARWLGNAEVWWQIADEAGVLHPSEAVARPGDSLVVPVPRI